MIKDIINKLFNRKNKIDDAYYTEFSNLVNNAKAIRNIIADMNVMLLQIINHEPINTRWEKINSLTFKDVGELYSFIVTLCTSAQDELNNAKAKVLETYGRHALSRTESSIYSLCDELLSSLELVKIYSANVNKYPENWTFDSIDTFANAIYYMNQTLIDHFDTEMKKIAG